LRANHVEESVPSSSNSLVVAADGSKKDVEAHDGRESGLYIDAQGGSRPSKIIRRFQPNQTTSRSESRQRTLNLIRLSITLAVSLELSSVDRSNLLDDDLESSLGFGNDGSDGLALIGETDLEGLVVLEGDG
jgi:hypothetical protein